MKESKSSNMRQVRLAKALFGPLSPKAISALKKLIDDHGFSVESGDVIYLGNHWYITHTGLLRLAQRRHCCGVHTRLLKLSDSTQSRWVFKAIVYKSRNCKGFLGYGDADPSNVSPLLHGAELRIAESRAVSRGLRRAYGIGVCSVEELGALREPSEAAAHESMKLPPQSSNGNGLGGPKVRDRLCQVIRQHQLDPTLVKSYATDFCGVKALRDASREQVESFVAHLAGWAEKDRNALLCQLNSYLGQKESVA